MPIIPSGKRRIMQAQSYSDPVGTEPALEQYRPDPMQQVPEQAQPPVANEELTAMEQQQKASEAPEDLSEYIFKFLEERGYPPRRLEEFEDEFVQEKIYSDNNREVTVVLPDRYYGTKKRFSDEDINKLVKTIGGKFKLSFIDGERKDKKYTINFSSVAPQAEVDESMMPKDDLDVIFGKGGQEKGLSKSKPKKPATPTTARER